MTAPENDLHPDGAPEPDELLALQNAFAALPVPEATPALDECDATTRAAVSWMADAFAALPAPDVDVPPLAAPKRAAPGREADLAPITRIAAARPAATTSWPRHAAAAAVFATLGLALWWARSSEQPVRVPIELAPVTAQGDAQARPAAIPGFREATPGPSGLVAVTSDHLEVSSGPVRLVLLTTGPNARGPSQTLP